MAYARLHLICGNCGSNAEWQWEFIKEGGDNGDGTFENDLYLSCKNCRTIHSLNDNAKQYKPDE